MIRTLLVDDNIMFLTQLQKYLTQHDVEVDIARSGTEALNILAKKTYDVVVLDLKMPDMSGIEVLRQTNDMGIITRFIILTGYGDVQSAVATMKLNAIDFLQKPFDGKDLLESIRDAATTPIDKSFMYSRKVMLKQLQQLSENAFVLAISEVHPQLFQEKCGITPTYILWLKDPALKEMLTNPEFILGQVRKFIENHDHVVVLQYGLKMLHTIYDKEQLSCYVEGLQKIAKKDQCQVVFMISMSDQENLADALGNISMFSAFEDMVNIIRHKVRCAIIQLLDREGLRYRDLLHHIDVKHSSDLSHHLNILRESGIIEKQNTQYALTKKGHHYKSTIQLLIMFNTLYQKGSIMYFPLC